MARVLFLSMLRGLTEPTEGDPLKALARHIEYKKGLDYYCIVARTLKSAPIAPHSPVDNMDVISTNSRDRYWFLWDLYRIASRVIEEKKIDVITVEEPCWMGLVGLILRNKYKIPLNVQVHGEFVYNTYFKRLCLEYRLWDAVGRFVLPRADTYYVGTTKQKKDMVKYGLDEKCIFPTPYTILTDKFEKGDPDSIRKNLHGKGFDNMLLWAGRMAKEKDIPTLLKAAALVFKEKPQTCLILLGDGRQQKAVKRMISDLKIAQNVIIPGWMSQQECINYYHAANVVCVSSVYEGTCRLLLEAMAAAKPVVTTDIAGAFDAVIQGKTGYIVPKRDTEGMAHYILELLKNPSAGTEMGRAGNELLHQRFTMEEHYEGFVNMWNETKRLGMRT